MLFFRRFSTIMSCTATRKLPTVAATPIKQRYHFKTYEELCRRVSANAAPASLRLEIEKAMLERRFCPAGNTLLAGFRPIRPNCSVLPTVTDENIDSLVERARRLWRHYTGIGFDLSGCQDPVRSLHCLMTECRHIEFGDRCQRGNMAVVLANHPEADAFAAAKSDEQLASRLYGFNISLAFDSDELFEDFLKQAEESKSGLLWNAAVAAWKSGCPGIAFLHRFRASSFETELDRLLKGCPIPPVNTMVPCGEQGIRENESCNLGVINLASSYHHGTDGKICMEKLRETTRLAVRFLDGVVDKLQIDDELMLKRTRQLRRVGLGVTGFADALISAGYAYDTEEAREYGSDLARTIAEEADWTSRQLAQQFGPYMKGTERRNLTATCCQPTGNISRLLGTRGYGIEPLMAEAAKFHWRDHLAMQAAWQKHIENAVSKTVNLPSDATVNDVLGVFREAYRNKLIKGIAVYRDGSRQAQPFSLDNQAAATEATCTACQL